MPRSCQVQLDGHFIVDQSFEQLAPEIVCSSIADNCIHITRLPKTRQCFHVERNNSGVEKIAPTNTIQMAA